MKKIYKILFLSQIICLGFFSISQALYVIESETNICGEFIKGFSTQPNWLPSGWKALSLDSAAYSDFGSEEICRESSVEKCCKALGFRYAGIQVGTNIVNESRLAAEFLASKGIIEDRSLIPKEYNLDMNISRKEFLKIIVNTGNLEISQDCIGLFSDIQLDDWSCKYIETALENNYIAENSLFRPSDTISISEALKLIFKAQQIEKSYNTGSWQEDYISTAYYLGYINEKNYYNTFLTRGELFIILARTYNSFGSYVE